MSSLLDRWERSLDAALERGADPVLDPRRDRLLPQPDPRLAGAIEEAVRAGYLGPALSRSAPAGRAWRDACNAGGLPDMRVQQQPQIKSYTIVIDLRTVAEPPTAAVIRRVADRLRRAANGRGKLVASATTIIGSRVPPEDVEAVVADCLALLRAGILPTGDRGGEHPSRQ